MLLCLFACSPACFVVRLVVNSLRFNLGFLARFGGSGYTAFAKLALGLGGS